MSLSDKKSEAAFEHADYIKAKQAKFEKMNIDLDVKIRRNLIFISALNKMSTN